MESVEDEMVPKGKTGQTRCYTERIPLHVRSKFQTPDQSISLTGFWLSFFKFFLTLQNLKRQKMSVVGFSMFGKGKVLPFQNGWFFWKSFKWPPPYFHKSNSTGGMMTRLPIYMGWVGLAMALWRHLRTGLDMTAVTHMLMQLSHSRETLVL